MKAIHLLLLLLPFSSTDAQSLDSLPVLQEVFASFDSNFYPVAGKLKKTINNDSIFHSRVTIEATKDNEICKFGSYHVYFAELGIVLPLEKARELVDKWNGIVKQLAKGYKTKSDQIGPTKGDYIGYQYRKKVGSRWNLIDVYYVQVGSTNTYMAGIEFTID